VTKIEITSNKRALLCLRMAVRDLIDKLAQLWSVTSKTTFEKASIMNDTKQLQHPHLSNTFPIVNRMRFFGP
jgi:hypothetical protein